MTTNTNLWPPGHYGLLLELTEIPNASILDEVVSLLADLGLNNLSLFVSPSPLITVLSVAFHSEDPFFFADLGWNLFRLAIDPQAATKTPPLHEIKPHQPFEARLRTYDSQTEPRPSVVTEQLKNAGISVHYLLRLSCGIERRQRITTWALGGRAERDLCSTTLPGVLDEIHML